MKKDNPYGLTSPCDQCPFRRDVPGFLREGSVREIETTLERAEFHCHKTLDYSGDEEDGEGRETPRTKHCAGALIMLEKMEAPSQMMRICERVDLYKPDELDMAAPVFDDFDEMAEHHAAATNRPKKSRKKKRTKL